MTKLARIKGTDFELENAQEHNSGYFSDHFSDDHFGVRIWVPKDWVEFYDPPREEPHVVGSVEIGSNGVVYVKVGRKRSYTWTWTHPNGDQGETTWEDMQCVNGPTQPMRADWADPEEIF